MHAVTATTQRYLQKERLGSAPPSCLHPLSGVLYLFYRQRGDSRPLAPQWTSGVGVEGVEQTMERLDRESVEIKEMGRLNSSPTTMFLHFFSLK